jgi:uncharacterized protein (TIGR03067 family)
MTALIRPVRTRKRPATPTERRRLQGVWSYVAGQRKAELLIAGDHFTVKFRNGDLYMGTFALQPSRKLKHLDMTIEEGPERHRGKVSLGIYRLEQDELHWSPGEPGGGRPAGFPAPQDRGQLYLVLRREHSV